ncbi:MAG: hypothetical protein HOK06_03695 [Rhodospirillaceae bacterium]|nr:hypothetical protein [Rhodospirillaceae bacterium]
MTDTSVKVCLIRSPIVVPANNQTSMFTPPLGLAYVAGTLRDAVMVSASSMLLVRHWISAPKQPMTAFCMA